MYIIKLPPVPLPSDHDYEEIQASYQISPVRPAPHPPGAIGLPSSSKTRVASCSVGTLGGYSELDGVPFVINPCLLKTDSFEVSRLKLTYFFFGIK